MAEDKTVTINQNALEVVETLGTLTVVKDDEDYELGGLLYNQGNEMLKKIDEGYNDLISSAHKLHKDLVAKKKKYYEPVQQAMEQIRSAMRIYKQKIDAEKARIEAQRKAEEDRLKKEQEEAAKVLIEEGKIEEAAVKLESKVVVSSAAPAPVVPKTEGGPRFQKRWHCIVTDFSKLPDEFKIPDMVRLNARAVADKDKFNVPGAKAEWEEK